MKKQKTAPKAKTKAIKDAATFKPSPACLAALKAVAAMGKKQKA